jgi:hypothetical protein
VKTVACIMLANGRREMVARAAAAFHAQDYDANRRRLLIWNTGDPRDVADLDDPKGGRVAVIHSDNRRCIGVLRNEANASALRLWPEVLRFAHWDSDDWSHPRRLAEQMELLDRVEYDLIGYRECVFWDSRAGLVRLDAGVLHTTRAEEAGEAWVYRNANPTGAIGSSFLYPRATWERVPFPNKHAGEDTQWLLNGRFKIFAVPSTFAFHGLPIEPRMICSIHGDNTSSKIQAGKVEWKRAPEYDELCRARMAL